MAALASRSWLPVWIAGLVALLRRPRLGPFRFFAVTWLVLVLVFLVTGGKPYYLAGMFPVALSGLVSGVIALPVTPVEQAGPVIAMNRDVGETIGWPELVRTVGGVYRHAQGNPVIFTANYGEAGAIDRYGPALRLPHAYSGHNAYADWGPPPDRPSAVLVIGAGATELHDQFKGCRLAARISNAANVNNEERGTRVDLCAGTRYPWSRTWSSLRHLG